ncbi:MULTISPECIES: EpsG family protein [Capnocytophaga]|uniref:EpsG family protein n=1 Tax=Capnocytophaga TaxID=1016 RepID=UPI0012FFAC8C|nr:MULTISPECIES: EpsG family protein [Capnocytophaga]
MNELSRVYALFLFSLLWILVVGGQYDVGADYFSYLGIFTPDTKAIDFYSHTGEIGFYWFVKFLFYIGVEGQHIFFILAMLWVLLFLLIISKVTQFRQYALFFFLIVCFNGVFHNQMNGLRQFTAMYILTYGVVLFVYKRAWLPFIICILLAQSIHQYVFLAVIAILIVLFLRKVFDNSERMLMILIFCFIVSFIDINQLILDMVAYTTIGSAVYLNSGFGNFDIPITAKLVKYVLMFTYVYAIVNYRKINLSENQKKLFILGIVGEFLTILSLNNFILQRVNMYFNIISLFPIFFLLTNMKNSNNRVIILLFLLIIYTVKVTIFADKEYVYESIFFN